MDLDSLFNNKVTTASKFAEKLSDAAGVISVVSHDELRRFGGVTLREILERVAGLSGFRTGVNDRSIVSVRGNQARVNGGHVLLLINCRPTREVAEGGVNEDILESFPSDLKLIGGFQLNKIGEIAAKVVPRGGLVWDATQHWTVKALYGAAFRAPSISETSLDFPPIKGNPRLGPEKVGTFDLSLGYQGARLQAGVNYFLSRYTGLVLPDASVFPLVYANRGASTFAGMELESKYYVTRNWLVLGSLLYQASKDPVFQRPVTPIPGFGAKAGVSYMAENGLTASLFHVDQPPFPGYRGSLNPSPIAQHLLNAHGRFDLTKRWLRGSRQGLALFVHGDNLGNRPVWLPDWGYGSADKLPARAGRTVLYGIEVWQKQ